MTSPRDLASGCSAGLVDRRTLLRMAGGGAVVASGAVLTGCGGGGPAPAPTTTSTTIPGTTTIPASEVYGPLGSPDANGLRLPAGFTSRVVATSGETVAGTDYLYPADPDGAATFAAPDGGWFLVQNHETSSGQGGVSSIHFAADGSIVGAQRILAGSSRNCAGGATPWGTWLSGEEVATGVVWECWPDGSRPSVSRPAMGRCNHEAAAVDPASGAVYLTEDVPDGALYRFRPDTAEDMSSGALEVATGSLGRVVWSEVPDPDASTTPTRQQVPGTLRFNGGEGICHVDGHFFFTTKGDNRIWDLEPAVSVITVRYDAATTPAAALTGVDNVTADGGGSLFVAEDGGDMQVVMVTTAGHAPVAQITGVVGSEVTGVCFNPAGDRFYCTSQRNPGRVYEISGPWSTM